MAVAADGGTTVVDLPTPVALPAGPEPAAWPAEAAEAPQWVLDEALAAVSGWGTEARLVAAQAAGAGWRLVLTVADEVGNRWPVSVAVSSALAGADGG